MARSTLQFIILTIIIVLAQVIVFNHVCLFDVAMPFVFIYVLLRLPMSLNVNWVLTAGFLLGLLIDMFSDTYGMNALAGTVLAQCRQYVLRLYLAPEEESSQQETSMHSLGTEVYAKYLLTMTLLYCCLIFVIEAFSFFNPVQLMLRIVASTLLSWSIMMGIDALISKQFGRTG
ncbi:MAG: rod shape-determining protein MreD [Muribaculaceae bacterium]|nr:rod shape-determining protein MreD [Muribaculaceae bacterium]